MTFDAGDVVRVPFPFTDRRAVKKRPALVLSRARSFNNAAGHSVMAMITSAAHPGWPLDCRINEMNHTGLSVPSMVRFKIFTLDNRLVLGRLGKLGPEDEKNVRRNLSQLVGA